MLKVLFLDLDGVLNTRPERIKRLRSGDYGVYIEASKVAILKMIIEQTNAKIVLISSWRRYWESGDRNTDDAGQTIDEALGELFLSIWEKTPVVGEGARAKEIEQWLARNPHIDDFAILDDKDFFIDSPELRQRWVRIDGETGLTQNDAEIAVGILLGRFVMTYATVHEDGYKGVKTLFSKLRDRGCFRRK